MTTHFDPEKIARLLTRSSGALDPATQSALSDARRKALQRYTAHVPSLPPPSNRSSVLSLLSRREGILAGAFAVMLAVGMGCWHQAREQQIADLDVAILTDDLPIEVFVD